jgi:KaiC/GvpD/RAD55 family RecA-like ATPase
MDPLKKVPQQLRDLNQWVVWRDEDRGGKPTKLPFSIVDGTLAKSNDPNTWGSYAQAQQAHRLGGYRGLGFMFSADDPFCGIDLDGCRNPETGAVAKWARDIIEELDSYSEISPSQTGVKVFCYAMLKGGGGRKKELVDVEKVCDKQPAIEIYDRLRYFAVTGQRLSGVSPNVEDRTAQIEALRARFWPEDAGSSGNSDFYNPEAVIERARKYLGKLPPSISGQGGHNAAFKAACVLVLGFGLARDTALALLREWNQLCQPPWNERELAHKVDSALSQPGERNYLRNVQPASWGSIRVPKYEAPPEKSRPRSCTMSAAMLDYLESILAGKGELIGTGIGELDYAIGGGLTMGELFVVAGRPSHGKSAVALQCVHHWTSVMLPCLVISEEMSKLSLGRRALLFTSETPEEYWRRDAREVTAQIEDYRRLRAECFIVESCQTMRVAEEEIERHVSEHGVKMVVVDYAQLLQSKGQARWEQMANTSETLRRLTSKHQIVILALVQMNQEIEKREKFQPKLSDLGDTGQWARDADVVSFVVWPHRLNPDLPWQEYKLYVAKNRNRPINASVTTCRFEPTRQRVVPSRVADMPNYEPIFGDDGGEFGFGD